MNEALKQVLASDGVVTDIIPIGNSQAIAFFGSEGEEHSIVFAITCNCIEKFACVK